MRASNFSRQLFRVFMLLRCRERATIGMKTPYEPPGGRLRANGPPHTDLRCFRGGERHGPGNSPACRLDTRLNAYPPEFVMIRTA
jgi:hypothetical protein